MGLIWRPDTCGCVLEYSNSSNLSEFFVRAVKTCENHSKLKGEELELTIKASNIKKNLVLQELANTYPELSTDVVDEFGESTGEKTIKTDVGITWGYDETEKLSISIPERLAVNKEEASTAVLSKYADVDIK